jgi:hypothetical protein
MVNITEVQNMKQIDVHFSTGCGEQRTIPVFYALENREEACIQIIKCKVGLSESKLPAWLETPHFDLVTHIRDGVRLVDYNASHGMTLKGWDAESFRYKVYTEIYFRERGKHMDIFFEC